MRMTKTSTTIMWTIEDEKQLERFARERKAAEYVDRRNARKTKRWKS